MVPWRETQKLKALTQKIVKKYAPQKIILFGSYAWGKPDTDSDVDLFIIKNSEKPRRERQRDLRGKIFPSGLAADLLVYTPEEVEKRLAREDFFMRNIIDKGKTLYDASK